MWVFEEILPTGNKLSESINEQNVRVRARLLFLLLDQQIKWLIYDMTLVIMTLNKKTLFLLVTGELQILARYKAWKERYCRP
jgi:hypothetical protein